MPKENSLQGERFYMFELSSLIKCCVYDKKWNKKGRPLISVVVLFISTYGYLTAEEKCDLVAVPLLSLVSTQFKIRQKISKINQRYFHVASSKTK